MKPRGLSSLAANTASIVTASGALSPGSAMSPGPAASGGGNGGSGNSNGSISTTVQTALPMALDEDAIREATRGMAPDEEMRFREKMKALSIVLQDEVKELQEQHTKLMSITEKGEIGQTLSKSNVRNLKKKSVTQKPSLLDETAASIVVLQSKDAESMIKRLLEKNEEYESEIRILSHERDSNNYIKEQSKARIQMYEESIANTEKMLMEAYQRLHVSANELSLKNRKIIDLETKLGLKQMGRKVTVDDLRLKDDLHDKEIIQMKTRLGMLEKENLEQKLKIDALQSELKRIKEEAEAESQERRARVERRKKERGQTNSSADDDDEGSKSTRATADTGSASDSGKEIESDRRRTMSSKQSATIVPDKETAPGAPTSSRGTKDTLTGPSPSSPKADVTKRSNKNVKPILYKTGAPRRIRDKENVFVSFSMNVLLLDGSLDGDLDLVKLCVKNGGDVNQPNEEGLTPLHSAACNGHAKIVNYLLENGANVNVVDDDLWTPLHGAACFGEVAVVRDLVQHGANAMAKNAENDTPLDIAVEDKTKKYLTEVSESLQKATQLYGLYDFEAEEEDELSFGVGAILTILTPENERATIEWWMAQSINKKKGFVPANYLGLYAPPKRPT